MFSDRVWRFVLMQFLDSALGSRNDSLYFTNVHIQGIHNILNCVSKLVDHPSVFSISKIELVPDRLQNRRRNAPTHENDANFYRSKKYCFKKKLPRFSRASRLKNFRNPHQDQIPWTGTWMKLIWGKYCFSQQNQQTHILLSCLPITPDWYWTS